MPYLNAGVLIEDVGAGGGIRLERHPPSRLAALLKEGSLDAAILPSVDYLAHQQRWAIAAPYGIAAEGPVWTVKVFSPHPWPAIQRLVVDSESHTSAALAGVLLWRAGSHATQFVTPAEDVRTSGVGTARLLIGDKALHGPQAKFVCDLGEIWHEQTGLPFVFALWVARTAELAERLRPVLSRTAERNLQRVDELARRLGPRHGFTYAEARTYLGRVIRYRLGEREWAGLDRFKSLLAESGVQAEVR